MSSKVLKLSAVTVLGGTEAVSLYSQHFSSVKLANGYLALEEF